MISSKPYNFALMPPVINALLVDVSDSPQAPPLLESLASLLCCLQFWHPTWHHAPTPGAKRVQWPFGASSQEGFCVLMCFWRWKEKV